MIGRRWWQVRVVVVCVVALGLSLRIGASAVALTPPITATMREDCNPCVTVVDRPAYDETTTVVDQPAYDETVTVVDAPATTATRTVVDAPARVVAHHDLVSPATTVARQVVTSAGHYQTVPALVAGHYERGPDQLVRQGYYQSIWISSGGYQNVWISDGYWGSQWVSSGYWGQQWVSSGYYSQLWQPDYYTPVHCWGSGEDRDCDGGWQPGYWYTGWTNTSHYAQVWIDTSHWTSVWVDTSHYQYQWVDTSHWGQQWIDTSYTQPTAVRVAAQSVSAATLVPSGYVQAAGCRTYRTPDGWDNDCWPTAWVSTSYYAYPTQAWVDPVYTTVYDPVAAVYRDWSETNPAVTRAETYAIPAVTHLATVHHDTVTHTVVIHHDAVTHQEQAAVVMSQSRQGSTPADNGTLTGTGSSAPVTIPAVETVTLLDQPASTRTVAVGERAANGAVTAPAVTPTETLRNDAIVGGAGGTGGSPGGSDSGLEVFALLLGLVALGGAGRFTGARNAAGGATPNGDPLAPPPPLAPTPADPYRPITDVPPTDVRSQLPILYIRGSATPDAVSGTGAYDLRLGIRPLDLPLVLDGAVTGATLLNSGVDAFKGAAKEGVGNATVSAWLKSRAESRAFKRLDPALEIAGAALDAADDIAYGEDWLSAGFRAALKGTGGALGSSAGLAVCGGETFVTFGFGVVACAPLVVGGDAAGAGVGEWLGDAILGKSASTIAREKREAAEHQQFILDHPDVRPPDNSVDWNLARHGQLSEFDSFGDKLPTWEESFHSFFLSSEHPVRDPWLDGNVPARLGASYEGDYGPGGHLDESTRAANHSQTDSTIETGGSSYEGNYAPGGALDESTRAAELPTYEPPSEVSSAADPVPVPTASRPEE